MTKILEIKRGILVLFSLIVLSSVYSVSSYNAKLTTKNDLLNLAVLDHDISAMKFLLKYGANPNERYQYNHTMLHAASLYGDIEIVKLLVENGAKLYKNDFNLTAINSAEDMKHDNIVKYLKSKFKTN